MTSLIRDNVKETREATIRLAEAIPADLYESCVVYSCDRSGDTIVDH